MDDSLQIEHIIVKEKKRIKENTILPWGVGNHRARDTSGVQSERATTNNLDFCSEQPKLWNRSIVYNLLILKSLRTCVYRNEKKSSANTLT